jgi:hypothetical protein
VGALLYTVTLYVLAFGFTDSLRQYPYEHYDFRSSGAATIQEFLRSAKGRATVTETTLGLLPIVLPLAAALGAFSAAVGGFIGQKGRKGQFAHSA